MGKVGDSHCGTDFVVVLDGPRTLDARGGLGVRRSILPHDLHVLLSEFLHRHRRVLPVAVAERVSPEPEIIATTG